MQNFLDFKNERVYENKKQKFVDFVVGLVIAIIAAPFLGVAILNLIEGFGNAIPLISIIGYLMAVIYLNKKRPYIAQGMTMVIILAPLAFMGILGGVGMVF